MDFATQVKLVSPLDYQAEEETRERRREEKTTRGKGDPKTTMRRGEGGPLPPPHPTHRIKRGLSEVSLTLKVRNKTKYDPQPLNNHSLRRTVKRHVISSRYKRNVLIFEPAPRQGRASYPCGPDVHVVCPLKSGLRSFPWGWHFAVRESKLHLTEGAFTTGPVGFFPPYCFLIGNSI